MDIKAIGSQIRHKASIVICLVGKGWVRFRELVCCAPAMASAVAAVLSVLDVRFHSWDWLFLYLGDELV